MRWGVNVFVFMFLIFQPAAHRCVLMVFGPLMFDIKSDFLRLELTLLILMLNQILAFSNRFFSSSVVGILLFVLLFKCGSGAAASGETHFCMLISSPPLLSSPRPAASFLWTAHGDGGLLLQRAGRPTLHVPRPRPGGSGEAGEPRGPRLLQAAGPLPHRHGRGEERRWGKHDWFNSTSLDVGYRSKWVALPGREVSNLNF